MTTNDSLAQVEQILLLVDRLSSDFLQTPDSQKSSLRADLQKVRSRIDALIDTFEDSGALPQAGSPTTHQEIIAARTHAVLATIPIGILCINFGWNVTDFNPRALEIIGDRDPQPIEGHNLWDAFPSIQGTPLEENCRRVMAERSSITFEMHGPILEWYCVSINPLDDGITITWLEIPERKPDEEMLKKAEELFARAFRYSSVAQTITRLSDGKILDVNESLCQLVNATRDEIIGNTTIGVGIYSDAKERKEFLRVIQEYGSIRNIEKTIQNRSGQALRVTLSLQPIEVNGSACLLSTIIDITEQKRIEEELRKNAGALLQSEARFHGAFNNAAIGFAMTTPDGQFVDANPAYCALTGYSIEELQTFAFDYLVHPEDREQNTILNQRMSAGEINDFVLENRYIRKDGQVVWVRKSISQVRNAEDVPKWNVALVEDVTERKRAEILLNMRNTALEQTHNDLINERNRLLAVMDALPVGLALYDQNGGVFQANQIYEDVWGSPRPPANSVDDYDLYKAWWVETGERVQPEEWASARAINGETVTGQYIQIQKFDGTMSYILNSGAPVLDMQGHIIGGVVTIMEITDHVNTEIALKESEDRFRVALTSLPLLVFTCDRDLRYNWVYSAMFGFSKENFIGKRDDEILPAEAVADWMAAKQSALDSGQGSVKEVKVSFDSQDNYYILTTEPMKDARDNVIGLTCSAIDITAEKRRKIEQEEKEMRMEVQRRLLNYREKERQEFARDIHDGPLQLLSGTIFNLYGARQITSDPAIQHELDQAVTHLKIAVRELRDTMNALRPSAIIHFGFEKSARMHVEDFRERYPRMHITLDMIDDGNLLSETARLALYRIFQESLNNIQKHSNADEICVQLSQQGSCISLRISDNGQGFSVPTELGEQTMHGHYGLAGMKERAEAIGAILKVTSIPGAGTTIEVTVPIEDKAKTTDN